MEELKLNKYQSTLEELNFDDQPDEIKEQFMNFINNIPFIKWMISEKRTRACDLPRDSEGKIIVDLTQPHILEDMDYFRPTALHFKRTGRLTDLRPNANPNSEYGKWIREEIRRCHYGYVRESDGEWVTGDMYWFLNYWPIQQTRFKKGSKRGDRFIDFPEVWDGIYLRYHYVDQAIHGGKFDWEGGKNGCEISSRGKAHPYSQTVYTPKGKTTWQNIKVGDYLFGDDGKLTQVINIPFQGTEAIYKITLKDGREIYSSGNHLWKVKKAGSPSFKILSTRQMLSDFARKRKISDRCPKGIEYIYRIPNHLGVDWEDKNTSVDPYTFGLLLGDGCFRHKSCYFTQAAEDFEQERVYIPYNIIKWKGKMQYRIDVPNWSYTLKEYGLYFKKSEEKFIPDEYKFNSSLVRLNILRGLMDSDGFVDSNGVPIIGVASKQLADDIMFIARSLGFNCLQSVKPGGYKVNGVYKKCLDSYIVRIFADSSIFRLNRKKSKVSSYESNYSRSNRDYSTIVNIEYSHTERCKCVTVDNESNCYLIGDFVTTHNSKSYTMSAMMGKRFILGETPVESEENSDRKEKQVTKCMATAYQKQYLTSDGLLNKFQSGIDFLAQNTQFPRKRLKSSLQDMAWKMGYLDLDTGTYKGTLNEVVGVSAKDDPSKVRGKRMNLIVVEEFGSFPNVLELYNIMIPSVQEGDISFGTMYLIGTAGDDESDFQGAQELIYNPKGYRMYGLPNVFDLEGIGRREITFFFPGYLNRKGCYDHDGNSDVTKALMEILIDRYTLKYNSSDINSITKRIAEIPITPQEAILRTRGNLFPVTQLSERLNQLDNDPSAYDSVYVGDMIINDNKEIEFKPSAAVPIREFPTKDNKVEGAVEIFELPQVKGKEVYSDRYIAGIDPVDQDSSDTMSLYSVFILDLWTDRIVAEYTGRPMFADDAYEITRRLLIYYNAKACYENNLKGIFSYFSMRNCTHLLCDTPEYLKDKNLVKVTGYGNLSKGVRATAPINNYANQLIRDWLLQPVNTIIEEDGQDKEIQVSNLYFLKNRALIKELIAYNPDINVDRIRALGMLMLYREEKMILYQGNLDRSNEEEFDSTYLGNDNFFKVNFDDRFKGSENSAWFE